LKVVCVADIFSPVSGTIGLRKVDMLRGILVLIKEGEQNIKDCKPGERAMDITLTRPTLR